MNKKIVSLVALVSSFCLTNLALAQVKLTNPISAQNFCQLLTNIFQAISVLIGSLGVIMIFVSGILFVTSAGSPERVNKARTALFYAVGGIVIALAATAIIATIKYIVGTGAGC